MNEPRIQIPDQLQPERGRFNFALILGGAALVVMVAALYFLPGRQSPPGAAPRSHFPFGPAEQEYAPQVRIENVTPSRAENFLHQEVTTFSGEVINGGERPLRGVEVTLEFFDEMNQIALREARTILAPGAPPLAPGERRAFEVSFEHIPSSWNTQLPTLRVTGLRF
jgi:hypothetical protein